MVEGPGFVSTVVSDVEFPKAAFTPQSLNGIIGGFDDIEHRGDVQVRFGILLLGFKACEPAALFRLLDMQGKHPADLEILGKTAQITRAFQIEVGVDVTDSHAV